MTTFTAGIKIYLLIMRVSLYESQFSPEIDQIDRDTLGIPLK